MAPPGSRYSYQVRGDGITRGAGIEMFQQVQIWIYTQVFSQLGNAALNVQLTGSQRDKTLQSVGVLVVMWGNVILM